MPAYPKTTFLSRSLANHILPTEFWKVTSPAQQETMDFKRAVSTVCILYIKNFMFKSLPVVYNPGILDKEKSVSFQFAHWTLEIPDI